MIPVEILSHDDVPFIAAGYKWVTVLHLFFKRSHQSFEWETRYVWHVRFERSLLTYSLDRRRLAYRILSCTSVVFGTVISGLDVVNAMEQVGSDSGKTRVAVVIADSGQLR